MGAGYLLRVVDDEAPCLCPMPPAPSVRTLLLVVVPVVALLLSASPALGKRKKASSGKSKGKGRPNSGEHARLLSERDRLLAALARAEQGCDTPAKTSPMKSMGRPVLEPAQLDEFDERGYTIVRGLVPGDVATGPCPEQALSLFLIGDLVGPS